MAWDKSYDVVVIGSGGAALAGAVAAATRGLSTCVIEKTEYFGGTSAYSGGSVWLPGNHVLARDGVDDSVAKGLEYFHTVVGDRTPEDVQRAFLETGPEVAGFLENSAGIPLMHQPFPDYFAAPGRSANGRSIFAREITAEEVGSRLSDIRPMLSADQFDVPVDRSVLIGGQAWIARLVLALDQSENADLRLRTRALSLVQEAGRVVGVIVDGDDGPQNLEARGGVLVAAGGYEADAALRREWTQMPTADWTSSSPDTGTGDAVRMLQEAGAKLDLLDQCWWAPATLFPNGRAVFTLGLRAGIVVDGSGQRFANELLPYDQMGRAMRERMLSEPGTEFWFVFDDTAGDQMPAIASPAPIIGEMTAAGLWHTADSAAELAESIGVDGERLTATIDRFNGFERQGHDDDFARGEDPYGRFFVGGTVAADCLLPIGGKRLHAVRLVLGDLGTKGGAVIDRNGAVQGVGGRSIDGLYAAGNSSASISGSAYPGPGTPLGSGMVMAYRAVTDMIARMPSAAKVLA